MFKIMTIRKGNRVAIWSPNGQVKYIDGPQRLFLWKQQAEILTQYTAEANQYLAVQYNNGHCDNIPGPVSIWYDPVEHMRIEVKKALPIDSNQAVVVYKQTGDTINRNVLRGPVLYVPSENEWLHEFSWHGADPKNPTHKIPRGLSFNKLRVIPDQMYFDVNEVRTADDAMLVIKLMIFFELEDIETMLDQTHDPIADFINAISADIIEFVGALTFEQFKEQTENLNQLETYGSLIGRAEKVGYKINKVVYRGYAAGKTLQTMHDNAIETRTRLKLEAETEQQAQELADLKLSRENLRAEKQQQMQQKQAEHEIHMGKLKHDEILRQQQAKTEKELTAKKDQNALEIESIQSKNNKQIDFLKAMQEMQIDLTRYLVAQYQNPDKLIRITGDDTPQLHLHN